MQDPAPFLSRMRQDAVSIFNKSIASVHAGAAVNRHCRVRHGELFIGEQPFRISHYKHIYVIGAGKASAQMGAAMESLLGGAVSGGAICVKYGHTAPLEKIRLIEAGHPLPDAAGMTGAAAIMEIAEKAGPDDLIICLLSGGGSALLPLPARPVTLLEKQTTIDRLLACGADIYEINAIRKHISQIKGGQLAVSAYPARIVTLALSDVVGDAPDVIASGPTVPDTSTFSDCANIIERYHLRHQLPDSVIRRIEQGNAGGLPETPKPLDPIFNKADYHIVGSNFQALCAARDAAEKLGYRPLILSSSFEGETRACARFHSAMIREIHQSGNPVAPPACLLSGGETTVVLKGNGRGGRNQEFALTAALEIAGQGETVILSAGTDGTDGPTDAAGAVVDSRTTALAGSMGLDPESFLENNDSYRFFKKTQNLLMTGPTGTNVMDIRIILIAKKAGEK